MLVLLSELARLSICSRSNTGNLMLGPQEQHRGTFDTVVEESDKRRQDLIQRPQQCSAISADAVR